MSRMKPHLRRVPATDIRRGDLIYLASERGLCRVIHNFNLNNLCDDERVAILDYSVVGYSGFAAESSVHCLSAWKVVGWDHPSTRTPRRKWSNKQLASLLDDVRSYPSETVDGIKGV